MQQDFNDRACQSFVVGVIIWPIARGSSYTSQPDVSIMLPASEATFVLSIPAILVGAAPTDLAGIDLCKPDWPVFAADGGVHTALLHHCRPRAVIGDMDSIGELYDPDNAIEKVHLCGQDDTDFEKSLRVIDAPMIVCFGFLGARSDHMLAVLHALATLTDRRPIVLVGQHDVMLRVRGDCAFDLPLSTRFSLWPLGRQCFVRSKGLAWPVDGLTMQIGKQSGTSNHVSETRVVIEAGPGDGYMVILPPDCLPALLRTASKISGISL